MYNLFVHISVKLCLLVLLCFINLSCTFKDSSSNEPPIKEEQTPHLHRVLSLADQSQFVHAGESLSVLVHLPNGIDKSAELFLHAYTYTSDNSLPIVSVFKVDRNRGSHQYSGGENMQALSIPVPVPSNAAWMNLSLVGYDGAHPEFQDLSFPVLDQSGKPMRNASLFAFASRYHGDTSLNYFYSERRFHPDNPVAFVAKWDRELQQGIMLQATLKEDVDSLNALPGSAEKILALYVAHTLLRNDSALFYLRSLKGLENNNVFNHPLVTGPLYNALEMVDVPETGVENLSEILCINNPFSLFTFYQLAGSNWKRWSSESVWYIAKKRLSRLDEPPVIYALLRSSDQEDHSSEMRNLAKKLQDILKENDSAIFQADPFRNAHLARAKYSLAIAETYANVGEIEGAYDVLSELVASLDPGSPNYALANKAMGRILFQKKDYESALEAFRVAYQSAGRVQVIKDSIKADVLSLVKDSAVVVQLLDAEELPAAVLPKINHDAPMLRIEDRVVSTASPNHDVVLEFFSLHCAPCNANLKNLAKQIAEGHLDNVDVVIVSRNDKESVEYVMEKLGVSFPVVENGSEVSDYFEIQSTPVTIRIAADGRRLYKVVGGGDSAFRF